MWGLSPPKGWLPQGSSVAAPARDQAQKAGISTLWGGGFPPVGGGTNPEGKLGQGAQGACSMPGSLLTPRPKTSHELPSTKRAPRCPALR